jgi:hypothetical protein
MFASRRVGWLAVLAVVVSLLGGGSACTQVLGDFTTGDDGGPSGDDGGMDVTVDHKGNGEGSVDGNSDVATDSTGDDGGGDAEGGPPPVPGKPGYDTVAGGSFSKSTNYSLFGAVGESPGSNTIGKSANYVLNGGVIAVSQ